MMLVVLSWLVFWIPQDAVPARMRSFAQEKKSQQAPEIDALVRDRKVFAWCHEIN